MPPLSGYVFLLILSSAAFFSFVAGWEVAAWKMKASELAAVKKAVAEVNQQQTLINTAEKTAITTKDAEIQKTIELTSELKHDKALIGCHIDSVTLGILRKASLPSSKLP